MEESSQKQVVSPQQLNNETIVLKRLLELLKDKLNVSGHDFLLLAAFVGYVYDFKLIHITEIDSTPGGGSPTPATADNFLDILEVLRSRYNLLPLLELLLDDGDLDPYSRSVDEYHQILNKVITLLGGESEGRAHILYSVADIARGELPKDQSDQKLLSLKTKNSIDTLIALTGLASLSGLRADLPELEEIKLSERIKDCVTSSSEMEAILKVLKVEKGLFEGLIKTIFTPGFMTAPQLFKSLHLEQVLASNPNLRALTDLMLRSNGSPAAFHANQENQSVLKQDSKIQIPPSLSNPAQTEVLQLALALRNGDISALYDYPNLKFHMPEHEGSKLLSLTNQLLALINPRSSRPLYDTFRALMAELGHDRGSNAIKLAALDMPTLIDIEETCGILKQALAGVLLAIEQFPCNMKAVWIERGILKALRDHDTYALQEEYSDEDYIEQAGYLENNRDIDYKNTERDYYETAVFNKFANYGYERKAEILRQDFGYDENILGKDEAEYYQHFANVWGQDVAEQELIYKLDTEEAELPRKKIDLITLKKQKEGSRPGSPVLSQDSVKGPFSACAGSLRRRWTKDADRDFVENIWKGMVVPLTKVGNVQIGDIIFAYHILALREIARCPDKVRTDSNAYNKMLHRIDDILHYIELHGLTTGVLTQSFDKYRLVKLISMALGVRVSAKAELWFLESVANQFKKEWDGQQKRDEVLERTILQQQVGYEWNEIVDFYKNQRDQMDLANLYHCCFPYEKESMLDEEKKYQKYDPGHYQVSRWIKQFIEKLDDKTQKLAELKNLNSSLMFQTMSLGEKMLGLPPPHRDPYTNLPIKQVVDYFRILEQYLVVECDTYELLLGLSECNPTIWQGAYLFLKATGTIHEDNELALGNSVLQLVSLRKNYQEAIRAKFSVADDQDWEVPPGAQENKEEPIPEAPATAIIPNIEDIITPLLEGRGVSIPYISELLAYSLGTPNTDSYENISNILQLSPQILQLLHTSGFALSRVIVPSLPSEFSVPEDQNEQVERVHEIVEQYDQFCELLSVDEPKPFSTRVLSALAFLPYNRKLALKLLFLENDESFKPEQQETSQPVETPRLPADDQQRMTAITNAPINLQTLFKLVRFQGSGKVQTDRRISAQVPITRSNFFPGGPLHQKFEKDFVFDIPEVLNSLKDEEPQKQLVVSHILIALVQGAGTNCIEDVVTSLNFLKKSKLVDQQLYEYVEQLVFQRFDMMEVKEKLQQFQRLDAGVLEEDQDEHLPSEEAKGEPVVPVDQDVFDKKNQGYGQGKKSQANANAPTKDEIDVIATVSADEPKRRLDASTEEQVKNLMPEKLQQESGLNRSKVSGSAGGMEQDVSFDSTKANKASAQPAPLLIGLTQQSQGRKVDVTAKALEERKKDLLRRFESRQVLNISNNGYGAVLLGVIDQKPALLKLIQPCLKLTDLLEDTGDNESIEKNLQSARSLYGGQMELIKRLDYESSECYVENAQFRRFRLKVNSHLPPIDCELVYPAEKEQIDKERVWKFYIIDETPEIYEKHTTKIIANMPPSNDQWITNILTGEYEKDRLLVDVKGPHGFCIALDYKYSPEMPNCLFHAVAIPRDGSLRTLRDLTAEHIPLLESMVEKGFSAIEAQFGIESYELIAYFHYLPTYFHLHLHFAHADHSSRSLQIGKAVSMRSVIQNLNMDSKYYSKAIMSIRLDEGHPLAQKLMQEVRESSVEDEDTDS